MHQALIVERTRAICQHREGFNKCFVQTDLRELCWRGEGRSAFFQNIWTSLQRMGRCDHIARHLELLNPPSSCVESDGESYPTDHLISRGVSINPTCPLCNKNRNDRPYIFHMCLLKLATPRGAIYQVPVSNPVYTPSQTGPKF